MPSEHEKPRRLLFHHFSPGGAMHAALYAVAGRSGFEVSAHTHDFCEMMLVLSGEARHVVNGQVQTLRDGDLLFLRPDDCHSLQRGGGKTTAAEWQHINVAFPCASWEQFRAAAHLKDEWDRAPMPPLLSLSDEVRGSCTAVFREALHAFQTHPSPTQWLDLCRFLSGALPFLLRPDDRPPHETPDAPPPDWLAAACSALQRDPDALREGLPRFAALAGVSPSHLARTLKAATSQTPTAYLNTLRLCRAATLLTTTTLPIVEISAECGFNQISYFYRLFQARYHCAPHAYRQRARRSVAP